MEILFHQVKDGQRYSSLFTSLPFCSATTKMVKDRGGSFNFKTYLSVQCDILCVLQFLEHISAMWVCFGMLLLCKTKEKHLGDLPPTVPDLSPPSPFKDAHQAFVLHVLCDNTKYSLSSIMALITFSSLPGLTELTEQQTSVHSYLECWTDCQGCCRCFHSTIR